MDGNDEMDFNVAIDMFRYHSGKIKVENAEVRTLGNPCGENPLAMKVCILT